MALRLIVILLRCMAAQRSCGVDVRVASNLDRSVDEECVEQDTHAGTIS